MDFCFSELALRERLRNIATRLNDERLYLKATQGYPLSDIISAIPLDKLEEIADKFFDGFPEKERALIVLRNYRENPRICDVLLALGRVIYRTPCIEAVQAFFNVAEHATNERERGVDYLVLLGDAARRYRDPEVVKIRAEEYVKKLKQQNL